MKPSPTFQPAINHHELVIIKWLSLNLIHHRQLLDHSYPQFVSYQGLISNKYNIIKEIGR